MRKKTLRAAALAAMAGCLLQFGGCLNLNGVWGRALWDGALYAGWEYLLDGGPSGVGSLGGLLGGGDTTTGG